MVHLSLLGKAKIKEHLSNETSEHSSGCDGEQPFLSVALSGADQPVPVPAAGSSLRNGSSVRLSAAQLVMNTFVVKSVVHVESRA